MSLQFADFNADGHMDIVTAVWEGTVFVVPGGKDGFGKPEHVLDADGQTIVLSRYYDMKARKYTNRNCDPEGESYPKDHLVSAYAWDWDQDGDLDLLLGAKEGLLYLRLNHGKPGKPKFETTNTVVQAGQGLFKVPGGMTAARPVDWDGDGLTDLVCGGFKGGAYLFRNTGKAGAPSFAAAKVLAKPEAGHGPKTGWYVDPRDYDGDGHLDLLVGARFMVTPKQPKLTAAQKKELAQLDADRTRLSAELSKLRNDFNRKVSADLDDDAKRKARSKLYRSEAYRSRSRKLNEMFGKIRKLRPSSRQDSGVWLLRREVASKPASGLR